MGACSFSRDKIVDKIKSETYCSKLSVKFLTREIDRQLLFFCKLGILDEPINKSKSLNDATFNLSKLAPTILNEDEKKSLKNERNLYEFAAEINDRQYRMYSWYTTKFQNLLTVGSFLFAGIVLLISSFGSLNNSSNKWLTIIFLITTAVSLLALAVSVGFGLYNLIPKLSSKIGGNEDNIRTLIGMRRFLVLQRKLGKIADGNNFYSASFHYYDDLKNLSAEQRLKFTVFQCIGMGKNNLKSESQLKIASILMIIAFATGIISIIFYGLNFIF